MYNGYNVIGNVMHTQTDLILQAADLTNQAVNLSLIEADSSM